MTHTIAAADAAARNPPEQMLAKPLYLMGQGPVQ